MKWMIASDIHGSALYCRMLLDRYAAEGASRLLLLGDLLYHGPRNDLPDGYAPKEVIPLLSDVRADVVAVRGNCDAEVDQMVLPFPIMADYALLDMGGHTVFATHGHVYNADRLPPFATGTVLLHGHTHVPACEKRDGFVYMNPGSVSIPKEGSERGYMTFEEGVFLWKTLEGHAYREYRFSL